MLKNITLFLFTFISFQFLPAQNNWCGLSDEDAVHIRERLVRFRNTNAFIGNKRSVTIYLPVRFHLVANSDGSKKISEGAALDVLCILNTEFTDHEIQFFLKEFNYIF